MKSILSLIENCLGIHIPGLLFFMQKFKNATRKSEVLVP